MSGRDDPTSRLVATATKGTPVERDADVRCLTRVARLVAVGGGRCCRVAGRAARVGLRRGGDDVTVPVRFLPVGLPSQDAETS